MKYCAKALDIRARKFPLDEQRRMADLNREDCPFAFQLISGSLLPHANPTSPRSTGFCAIWDCISSSSSSGTP